MIDHDRIKTLIGGVSKHLMLCCPKVEGDNGAATFGHRVIN
jgi:hypothetical protein